MKNKIKSLLDTITFYLKEAGISFLQFIKKTFSSKKTIIGSAMLLFFILL